MEKKCRCPDGDANRTQEIYGKLEEPDGLGGLIRLRPEGPRLQDQILASEKAGSWNEALELYEQALQSETATTERQVSGLTASQRGHLQCLLQMGHLQGMLAQIDGWSLTSDGEDLISTHVSFLNKNVNHALGTLRFNSDSPS